MENILATSRLLTSNTFSIQQHIPFPKMSEFQETIPKVLLDNQGKIDKATDYKNTGNQHFKDGKFKKAIVSYSTAIAYTKGLPGRKQGLEGVSQMAMQNAHSVEDQITPEQEVAIVELEVAIKTNISTCYIKLEKPVEALEAVREALALNPKAWKTLLRKAEAVLLLNDPEKALTILAEADQCATDEVAHTAIVKLKEKATKILKQQEAKQRKAFGNIFEKARGEEA